MHDMTMRERQGVNIFESIPENILTIASGTTPIGSASCAPHEIAVIGVMEQAVEHIIDYLIKR
jgi:hypothetical protein